MKTKNSPGAGTIRRRPNGTWEARYTAGRSPEGKQLQRSLYGRSRAEVSRKLITALGRLESGGCILPAKITLGDWLDRWMEDYAEPFIRTSTRINYRGYIENHIRPLLGGVRLKDLSPQRLQEFYNERARAGHARCAGMPLSAKTLQNIHNMLHKALEQACRNSLLPQNPSEHLTLPRIERREMRVLTVEEQRRLTAAIPNEPLGFAILFDLATGLRLGELCGLKWCDIDFQERTFRVVRGIRRVPSEQPAPGAPHSHLAEQLPKTENSIREVPIQDVIFAQLLEHRIRQSGDKARAGARYDDQGFVFAGPLGGIPDPHQMRSLFNRLQHKAGLDYANFHSLRHTFATRAIESGVPVKAVSDILGHTTVKLTMDLYCHSSMELKRSVLDRMSVFWTQPSSCEAG